MKNFVMFVTVYTLVFALCVLVIVETDKHVFAPTSPVVQEVTPAAVETDNRADRLHKYFKDRNMPLAAYSELFVIEADKNGIDWRLVAAISVRESSGGKHMIPGSFNAFGWGSGTISFKSYEEAIGYISEKLGSGKYYAGKDSEEKLRVYNPPSVDPEYPAKVLQVMNMF